LKIALIQQHATTDLDDNISRAKTAFLKAAKEGAGIIAFSELAFLPFLPQKPAGQDSIEMAEPIPGPTTEIFSRLAKEHKAVTVINLFERSGQNTFYSSPVIDADGSICGIIRMVHVMNGQGFFEKGYYSPGDKPICVFETMAGRIGIAICYDRHFPEYMRHLGLLRPEIVIVPQAGVSGEWPEGIFEAELQVAAFQNGFFAALVNRVGKEDPLMFSGESYVVDPSGQIIAQSPEGKDHILYADCDFNAIQESPAKKYFLSDRRPDFYRKFIK